MDKIVFWTNCMEFENSVAQNLHFKCYEIDLYRLCTKCLRVHKADDLDWKSQKLFTTIFQNSKSKLKLWHAIVEFSILIWIWSRLGSPIRKKKNRCTFVEYFTTKLDFESNLWWFAIEFGTNGHQFSNQLFGPNQAFFATKWSFQSYSTASPIPFGHQLTNHEKSSRISHQSQARYVYCILGLIQWNLSCFELKFDYTRLSS